jgi:excinuclease ABC subunit B
MMEATGSCAGIENYSRYLTGRKPGEPPPTCSNTCPTTRCLRRRSHVTVPQIGGMFRGDFRRKSTLAEYGFRLPSCMDNRPLRSRNGTRCARRRCSSRPRPALGDGADRRRLRRAGHPPDRPDRPAGRNPPGRDAGRRLWSTSPPRWLPPRRLPHARHRADQAHGRGPDRIHARAGHPRALHALRHRHAGAHRDHPRPALGASTCWSASTCCARASTFPNAALVAILDADKEGFLRSETSLIQTIGRAARNVDGKVILYADRITGSMERAMAETNRRREKQVAYNARARHHASRSRRPQTRCSTA